jgi:hypothetical protein
MPWALLIKVKWTDVEADYTPPYRAEIKNAGSFFPN